MKKRNRLYAAVARHCREFNCIDDEKAVYFCVRDCIAEILMKYYGKFTQTEKQELRQMYGIDITCEQGYIILNDLNKEAEKQKISDKKETIVFPKDVDVELHMWMNQIDEVIEENRILSKAVEVITKGMTRLIMIDDLAPTKYYVGKNEVDKEVFDCVEKIRQEKQYAENTRFEESEVSPCEKGVVKEDRNGINNY